MSQFQSSSKRSKRPKFGRRYAQVSSLITARLTLGVFALHLPTLGQSAYAQSANSDGTDFDAAFRELKRNDSLQFDFTVPVIPPKTETPQWINAIGDFFDSIFGFIGTIFNFLTPVFHAIFWLGVGAFAMAVIYLLVTTLMAANLERRSKTADDTPPPLYQPEQSQARILLAEIDALAAQGKYAEAVHTLLFRSIQDIDANRPNIIRRSLTSREIGGLTILTVSTRDVFARIASVVERSFFGGQEIGKTDFDSARADYVQLAGPSGQWTSNAAEAAS